MALQAEHLSRQENMLNEMRDTRATKAERRLSLGWLLLLTILSMLIFGFIFMDTPTIMKDDTLFRLNVMVTPVKAPFITTGVKVRFTMMDLMACLRGAMSGESSSTTLLKKDL